LEKAIKDLEFHFLIVNHNFSPLDFEKPVHPFLDDVLVYELESDMDQKADIFIQH